MSEIKPNLKQQECINNTQGKYLVLAGPGTGKTYTIIERIKKIISDGVSPEKILCLTFTDAAASEMKKRIEKELDVLSCDVNIFTYHGFCSGIMEENQELFEIPSNYKIITDVVSKALIKECIDEINPKYFRTPKNDPYFYINTIKNRINTIKQHRLSKEDFEKNIKENPDWEPQRALIQEKIKQKIEKGKSPAKTDESNLLKIEKKINQAFELWEFYEKYNEKMAKRHYIDFNDMINIVLEKFDKDKGFLFDIANKYEYLFVDEYQDTNKSQNEIVLNLVNSIKTQNVFVVGDDDQIIYRFQGAKLDTIQNFLNTFKDTKIICLTENMRSTQSILDVSRSVISQDPLSIVNSCNFKDKDGNPISKDIKAKNKKIIELDKKVRFYSYADNLQEKIEIVNEINELIKSDNCPIDEKTGIKKLSEIAILTRSNSELTEYAELLKQKNIPFELKDGKDIFTIPAVNILYFYMQFLVNPNIYSARIFQLLLIEPFKINPKDYQLLLVEMSKTQDFLEAYENIDKSKLKNYEKINKFINTYKYLSEFKNKENLKNTILEIGAKTGIFDYFINSKINQTENIAGLKKIIDEAIGFGEIFQTSFLEEFMNYLSSIQNDDDKILTDKAPVTLNAVQLVTYHSSKGREFEYVYMPQMTSNKWETNTSSLKSDIPLDISEYKTDEQIKKEIKPSDLTKLMYVAMTRAKHSLRLSYSSKVNGKDRKTTIFLNQANSSGLLEKEETPFVYDEITYWQQIKNILEKDEFNYDKEFSEFINTKLNDREFSPSSINRYLACPRQYLFNDILDLTPQDGNPNFLSYGISIHHAMEKALNFIKENETFPTLENFVSYFKEKFAKLPMENYNQRQNFLERGIQALTNYYPQITNLIPKELYFQEYKIKLETDGVKFVGVIDRVDKNSDGTYTIIDYKTGNNKTSQIKINGEHEDYYNQMAWYKFFFELKENKKVSKCQFIYPEDFLSKNNPIEFTDEELKERVELFKQAISSIKSHNFKPSHKEQACLYCAFKSYCDIYNQ